MQRGVGDTIFRSPFDQPTGVTDNPSKCSELRWPRFLPTDSQLMEMIDASIKKILKHRSPTKTSTPLVQLTPTASHSMAGAMPPLVDGLLQELGERRPIPGNWQWQEVSLPHGFA